MKKIFTVSFLGTILCFWTAPSWAVTPIQYYNSFVAGADDRGFRDGAFAYARFNEPLGLALDETGNQLYVADSGNNRIRVIQLDKNNEVKTLAGMDSAGAVDGPLSKATFNRPAKVSVLPGRQLAVYDQNTGLIRLIDLSKQAVSTIATNAHPCDMVYRPQDDSLYWTEGDRVEKLEMKSRKVSTILAKNTQIPSPGAICLYQDHLCVADTTLPGIYEVKLDDHQPSSPPALSLVGNVTGVLGLAFTDGNLYALQSGGFLIKVGLPVSVHVKFPSAWGILFENQEHGGVVSLFNIQSAMPAGFLASNTELRKFYIASEHSIVSVKDYNFEKWWSFFTENVPSDFDYPVKKPARTFRILSYGGSRNSTAVLMPSDPQARIDDAVSEPRVSIYCKKMEFLLNTEAALQNSDIHYEVLNFTRRGLALGTFAAEVPDIVKKYDIDLVIAIADRSGYQDYYTRPLTAEGIPAKAAPANYMSQTLSQRASSPAATDVLKRCKEIKFPISEKQDYPGDGIASLVSIGDPQIQKDMIEMTGRRLALLRDNLQKITTSDGHHPPLVIFYAPSRLFPDASWNPFWAALCAQFQLKFLDLTESYDALKTSYYPDKVMHYTANGNELIARILIHDLKEEKLIP